MQHFFNCVRIEKVYRFKNGGNMISIDVKSDKPIYEQIIEQMKFHVAKGNLKGGDAIPSVRKLALDLKVTPGTVAKAYQELERCNVIVTIRGKGTFISEDFTFEADEKSIDEVKKKLKSDILELKMNGFEEKDVTNLVKEIYKELGL